MQLNIYLKAYMKWMTISRSDSLAKTSQQDDSMISFLQFIFFLAIYAAQVKGQSHLNINTCDETTF